MNDVLQELRDKVAAGEFWADAPRPHVLSTDLCWKAFSGSLDAAKALHEALLPGWGFRVAADDCCEGCVTAMDISGASHSVAYAQDANIARAWLLAILDALIQGDKADG